MEDRDDAGLTLQVVAAVVAAAAAVCRSWIGECLMLVPPDLPCCPSPWAQAEAEAQALRQSIPEQQDRSAEPQASAGTATVSSCAPPGVGRLVAQEAAARLAEAVVSAQIRQPLRADKAEQATSIQMPQAAHRPTWVRPVAVAAAE